jgi:hypothetical protein
MNKKTDIIDPRAIAADFFRRLGGMEGMTKWGKTHRSLAYQLISKLMAQPLVQVQETNVTVDGAAARQHLEDALIRLIAARKASVGDPAVYVDGERVYDDGHIIEHQPATRDGGPATDASTPEAANARLGTPDAQPSTDVPPPGTPDRGDDLDNPKSWQKGPLSKPGGVQTSTGAGEKTKTSQYSKAFSSIPGLAAGAALDGSDDNRSTTQKYLEWPGHNRPP